MRTMFRTLGGLRLRAMIVVVAVVVLPLVLVWFSDLVDRYAGEGLEIAVNQAAADVAEDWRKHPDADQLDRKAYWYGIRVRIIEDGQVIADADHAEGNWANHQVARLFFGPALPSLHGIDATLAPVVARPEVVEALEHGVAHNCLRGPAQAGDSLLTTMDGSLLICSAARRVVLPDGNVAIVHAQDMSRRAIHTLYGVRYPLIKLTLYMLVIGVLLSLWLNNRMVAPLERLRSQVLAGKAATRMPIVRHDRPDEIGELAGAFNELLVALDDRNRANASFIADLVHEMKNPVAAIRACAEAMEGPVDQERAERLSRVLRDSSRRLDVLVTRFLEIARAEAGLPGQPRVEVELRGLADGVVGSFRNDERFAGTSFAVEGDPATVIGVSERLETALRNLLDNAATFAGPAGRVRVRVRIQGDAVAVEVADTGPGIAPEDQKRLFERFFTRRPDGKGTGLGLALTRAIAEAHGGRIGVVSQPGATTFTLWLKGMG